MNAFRRIPIRTFAAAAGPKPTGYVPKTAKDVWCGDTGAYPVMFTIFFGLCFSTGTIIWATSTNADSRVTDKTRKSLFRGELAKEYQNPAKPHHAH